VIVTDDPATPKPPPEQPKIHRETAVEIPVTATSLRRRALSEHAERTRRCRAIMSAGCGTIELARRDAGTQTRNRVTVKGGKPNGMLAWCGTVRNGDPQRLDANAAPRKTPPVPGQRGVRRGRSSEARRGGMAKRGCSWQQALMAILNVRHIRSIPCAYVDPESDSVALRRHGTRAHQVCQRMDLPHRRSRLASAYISAW